MLNHERRASRAGSKRKIYAYFDTKTIVPPDNVDTDDEDYEDDPGSARGRRIVRRRLQGLEDEQRVLSKFNFY